MLASSGNQPCEAPLTCGDVPEQDGSEDPGAALEFTRNAMAAAPLSPSAAEHVNMRNSAGLTTNTPEQGSSQGGDKKPKTIGTGEGATVSHVPHK